MTLPELFDTHDGLQSAFIVVRIVRARVVAQDEQGNWTEEMHRVEAWNIREDAWTVARRVGGLVVFVKRNEYPPVSGHCRL